VELNDRYVEALLNRGITLSLLGRTEEARESFVDAAEADEVEGEPYPATVASQLANAHHQLGDMYAEAGDLAVAIGSIGGRSSCVRISSISATSSRAR
jgi:tetratricopeptide (TPR) repeat protein